MQVITSKDNEMVKEIRKLKEKKYREETNCYLVEGIKMIEEAIEEKANIQKIVICEDCVNDGSIDQKLLYNIAKYNCVYVNEKVFEGITDVTTPQGILAVVEKKNDANFIDTSEDIIIALDGIQDPGNLGTILRTIDSANLKQVIITKNTTDPYNPKVVRSTMGAIYRINIVETEDLADTLKKLKKKEFETIVTSLEIEEDIYNIDYHKKIIVIGNEANGVSKEIQKIADKKVKIPMLGKTESLNASVATAIMIYEYVRQKIQ